MNLKTQNGNLMIPIGPQEQQTRSHDDILVRRLKNRDRQRRYRARKRREADTKRTILVSQSTSSRDESQLCGISSNCISRVRCQRDWKKDARRAHAKNKPEVTLPGPVVPGVALTSAKKEHSLSSEVKADTPIESNLQSEHPVKLNNHESSGTKHGRRDWKAAARNRVD